LACPNEDYAILSNSTTSEIPTDAISPELLKALITESGLKEQDIVITRSATASNNGSVQSVVLGLKGQSFQEDIPDEEQKEEYVLLRSHEETTTPGDLMDPNDIEPNIPTNDPSYAILSYTGGDVTIICRFESSCGESLTASVFISGTDFSCSYTNDSHSIVIVGDDTGDSGCVTDDTYTIYIYNDYGFVKQVQMKSGTSVFHILMTGYPNGFYYVNIVNEQGNVITRQTVQVN
jgi:hypothetical protein